MDHLISSHPAIGYLAVSLRRRWHRATAAGTTLGATAVEWVVISAIVVAIAIAIGAIIKTAVTNKASTISNQVGNAGN
jgi:Flp pilus assembly pilin Flp